MCPGQKGAPPVMLVGTRLPCTNWPCCVRPSGGHTAAYRVGPWAPRLGPGTASLGRGIVVAGKGLGTLVWDSPARRHIRVDTFCGKWWVPDPK